MPFDAAAFLQGLFTDRCRSEAGCIVPAIGAQCDLPPEWHYAWDERAAIMEYDGGMSRERAEALALADIRAWMSDVNGTRRSTPPGGDARG